MKQITFTLFRSKSVQRPANLKRVGAGAGFSMVELLSVMAAMSVMVALVMPALTGAGRATALNAAAYDIAGTLEQARSYAMANNTYVFVGIAEQAQTASQPQQLLVGTMASKDGTRDFGTDNANLAPLCKLMRISQVRMADALPNTGALSRPSVPATLCLGNASAESAGTFAWPVAPGSGVPSIVFTRIIRFDPRGAAGISATATAIPQYLEVGLLPATGSTSVTPPPTQNCAALVVDGLTGSVPDLSPVTYSSDSPMRSHSNRTRFRSQAFSLVEVTLALAVAGFCLIALVGILQTGLTSEKNTMGQTAAANLTSLVFADLISTPRTDTATRAFGIVLDNQTIATPQTLYFKEDGTPTGSIGSPPSQDSRYRVTIGIQSPAAAPAPKTATRVRILVTWPAAASPDPGTWPASITRMAEVVTALDRN